MRTRLLQVTACAVLALAAAGCKGELNHAFCAQNPADGDCRDAGLVRIDAPPPECQVNGDCAGNAGGTVCDTTSNMCVECLPGDQAVCTSQMKVCGDDQRCHACIVDTDCPSRVCLPDQTCAAADEVLYAAPGGTGTTCSQAAPCTLADAVTRLQTTRSIIKLTTTFAGPDYSEPAVTIAAPYPVHIIGTGTTFTPTSDGAAITAAGASLEVVGLTITGARGDGLACTAGAFQVRRVTVTGSTGWGVRTSGCNATIERSRFSSNPQGGMNLTGGTLEVRNNIIDRNGNTGLSDGNVRITDASGRFVFNTLAYNRSRGGGSRTGGISCTPAGGGFRLARNILADFGDAGNAISGDCTSGGLNFVTPNAADVRFDSTTDLRLTAASPPGTVLDDSLANDDCLLGDGTYITDHEGQARPVVHCDKGADEYRP